MHATLVAVELLAASVWVGGAGEAKSYAERLFKFPRIGQLTPPQAESALAQPAADLDVLFEPGAIDVIVDYTEGYPYFLQEYGKIVWDLAPEHDPISPPGCRRLRAIVKFARAHRGAP